MTWDLTLFRNAWHGNVNQSRMEQAFDALAARTRLVRGVGLASLADIGYNRAGWWRTGAGLSTSMCTELHTPEQMGHPVGLDDFWQACGTGVNGSFHDQDGHPLVNTTHFPDLKAMVAHATQLNLYADFYSNNCGKNPWCLFFCGQAFIIAYFFIQFQVVTSSSPSPTQHSSKWRSRNRWISWLKPIFRGLSWMAV